MSTSITKSLTTQQPLAPPSPRDLAIYKRCIVFQHDQLSICADYNLGQPRISQIVAKVRRWLAAGGAPSDPAIRDHLAQQKLSKATQTIRLQRVIDMATYAMENRLQSQVTTKSRYQGMTEVWREEVRQQSPEVNMPAMRLLLRAVKTLDDLDASAQQDTPTPKAAPLSEDDLAQSVFQLVCRWRTRAEATGRLPQSDNLQELVAEALSALIGITLDPTGRPLVGQASCLAIKVGQASCLPLPSDPTLAVIDEASCHTQISTNTAAHISAAPQLLVAPTTNQPSLSDN